MLNALAPRGSRGCSWVWLAIALIGLLPLVARAQPPGAGGSTKESAAAPKGAAAKAAVGARDAEQKKKGAVDTSKEASKVEPPEQWPPDPRVQNALEGNFRPLQGGRAPSRDEQSAVLGLTAPAETIAKYVRYYAAELTNPSYLKALTDPDGDTSRARKIAEATDKLVQPLMAANAKGNTSFRREYTKALLALMPELLKNQLHARIEAMLVLSRSGDPQAVPTFIEQLKDPDQVIAVKDLAAIGLLNVAQGGRARLDEATVAIPGAAALTEFLEKEPEAPWPVKAHALEALGALRQPTPNPLRAQADFATTALG
ncbi:MAG: hypothetical protein IRY99_17410, partial [Isosphaeraceae bacterium]|nr:hypothetical protein [Isosphaeraceae bacterium]